MKKLIINLGWLVIGIACIWEWVDAADSVKVALSIGLSILTMLSIAVDLPSVSEEQTEENIEELKAEMDGLRYQIDELKEELEKLSESHTEVKELVEAAA